MIRSRGAFTLLPQEGGDPGVRWLSHFIKLVEVDAKEGLIITAEFGRQEVTPFILNSSLRVRRVRVVIVEEHIRSVSGPWVVADSVLGTV